MMKDLFGGRILVTGASGFIGRYVIEALASAECEVVATYHERLPASGGDSKWVALNVADEVAVANLIAEVKPSHIINLAARNGHSRSVEDVENYVTTNFHGVYNILRGAMRCDGQVDRIVLMGSGDEYGRVPSLPVTENQRTHPISPFAASKAGATHFARVYHQLFRLPVVVLRPFLVYGPGQPSDMFLPSLLRSIAHGRDFAMTAGTQTRDFVYVTDVVAAILRAMTVPRVSGEVLNISSGTEHTVQDVASRCVKMAGSSIRLLQGALPFRRDEVWRSCGNNERARRMLDWQPDVDLNTGLRLTIDAFSELPEYA